MMEFSQIRFIRANVAGMYTHSSYAAPSATMTQHKEMLGLLVSHTRGRDPKALAGDFNAPMITSGRILGISSEMYPLFEELAQVK